MICKNSVIFVFCITINHVSACKLCQSLMNKCGFICIAELRDNSKTGMQICLALGFVLFVGFFVSCIFIILYYLHLTCRKGIRYFYAIKYHLFTFIYFARTHKKFYPQYMKYKIYFIILDPPSVKSQLTVR